MSSLRATLLTLALPMLALFASACTPEAPPAAPAPELTPPCHVYFSKVCAVQPYETKSEGETNKYTGLSPIFVYEGKTCPGEGDLQVEIREDGRASFNGWGVQELVDSDWSTQLALDYERFVNESLPAPCVAPTDGDNSAWAGFYRDRAKVQSFAEQIRAGWEAGAWQGGCFAFTAEGSDAAIGHAVCTAKGETKP